MKFISVLLTLIAVPLIVFNATKIDLDAPLQGDSIIAIITIVAALCAVTLLHILRLSKRIAAQLKTKRDV